MAEQIYILTETTSFTYGKKMWDKFFYYRTFKSAKEAKIKFQDDEEIRVSKWKEISKKKYVDRTGDEICFDSNNSFFIREYKIHTDNLNE